MRFKTLIFFLLCFAGTAWAQFTLVTGTVADPNGIPYAYGTVVAQLVSSTTPTLNGLGYSPPSQPTGLSLAGQFSMSLAPNASLSPGGSTWNFTVCSAAGTVQPAGGRGPICFTVTGVTISGSSQDISSILSAAASALVFGAGGGGSGTINPAVSGLIAIYSGNSPTTTLQGDTQLDDSVTTPNTLTYAGSGGISALSFHFTGPLFFSSPVPPGSPSCAPGANLFNLVVNANGNLAEASGANSCLELPVMATQTVTAVPFLSQIAAAGAVPKLTSSGMFVGGSGNATLTIGTSNSVPGNIILENSTSTQGMQLNDLPAGATIASLGTNENIQLSPNGSGLVVVNGNGLQVPTGSRSAFSIGISGGTKGLYWQAPGIPCFASAANDTLCNNGAFGEVGDAGGFCVSQTAQGSGSCGASLQVLGTGSSELWTVGGNALTNSECKFNALLIGTGATNLCSTAIQLPNSAQALTVICELAYVESSAATLALGYTFTVTPSNVLVWGGVYSSNTGTITQNSATTAGTSNVTVVTGATPGAAGTYQAYLRGRFTSASSSSTLQITGLAGAASTVTATGSCEVY